MRKPWPWLVALVWALYTFGPVLGVLLATAIAGAHGCALDEGSVHPCVVAGQDIGGTLSTLFVLGWLMLITLPTGLIAGVGLLIVALVLRRRSPPS